MINIPFDQYQRYKIATDVVNILRTEKKTFNILEVGSNAHRNLEKFLPFDCITYIDIDFPEYSNEKNMIKGDATNMEFTDDSFDIIVALDVYEHISSERREMFLSELNRVSKLCFILGAPFNHTNVRQTEMRVNALYKSLYGTDYIWLQEHIDCGLPNLDYTERYLEDNKISYIKAHHGNLEIWEKLMSMYFLSCENEALGMYKLEIDKFYNDHIYPLDFEDNPNNTYRSFIIAGKYLEEENLKASVLNLVKQSEIGSRTEEYGKLKEMSKNFYASLGRSTGKLKTLNEYIEIFADDFIGRISITEEEIISGKSVEKFIPLPRKIIEHGVRIDPCNKSALVCIENIFIKQDEKIESVPYTTTSTLSVDNVYYFSEDDPQIKLNNVMGKELTGVIVRFRYIQYENLNLKPVNYIIKILDSFNKKVDMVCTEKDSRLREAESLLLDRNKYILQTEDKFKRIVDELNLTKEKLNNKDLLIKEMNSTITKLKYEKEKHIHRLDDDLNKERMKYNNLNEELEEISKMNTWEFRKWRKNRRR